MRGRRRERNHCISDELMTSSSSHPHEPLSFLNGCHSEKVKVVGSCMPPSCCPGTHQVFQTDVGWVLPISRTPTVLYCFSYSWALTFGSRPRAHQCFIGHMNFDIFRFSNRNSLPKLLTLLSWHS